jgi:hypothetical protein
MNTTIVQCDGNGCAALMGSAEGDPRPWLKLLIVGGHPHEVFDFCPSCAASIRALMPQGPEPPPAPELRSVHVIEGMTAPAELEDEDEPSDQP